MGYRVYEDASKTTPRVHRDYANVQFELLDRGIKVGGGAMASLSGALASSIAIVALAVAF